ncbi:MAG: polyribonucleotide nucleotidyltransferase [Deltaproteobacteria bacterium]|nr:polyribonucleotide nucleotidyltransferase [Deltaproteobacteria bacterium]
MHSITADLGGRPITIETGKMARQAGGSALVRYGDTVVLVAATAEKKPKPGLDFFPLSVHYIEKFYAAGRIPGSFFRREGRLTEHETLISRFIDRPIRPLFPKGYRYETQVIATVMSADPEYSTDVAAMLGASAALTLSDIPFDGPVAGVRMGRVNGQFIVNPTSAQLDESELDFFVAGTKDAILMVEGESQEVSEDVALEAILTAHRAIQPVIAAQVELAQKAGKPKRPVEVKKNDPALEEAVKSAVGGKLDQALRIQDKMERYAALDALGEEVTTQVDKPAEGQESRKGEISSIFSSLKKNAMRQMILKEGKRIDGRSTTDVRPITIETGVLPRTHGSALFTRGETQALVTVTLGARTDEQLMDTLKGVFFKDFLFHYNFPSFSVGEVSPLRGPGRREVGHGYLAEKGVTALLPSKEQFPYTLRVVSEILESNGSSSMASVCGASLAMMDAGVPLPTHAAGIAMGLIQEGSDTAVLSDILGDEDHLGDMDFKVAGTREGITALQMDMKITGIDRAVLEKALTQAKDGRMHILSKMEAALAAPRKALSPFAPRFIAYKINPDRIRDVIGPGGKVIKGIVEKTGVKMDVADDGVVSISGLDHRMVEEALNMVKSLTAEIEVGSVYTGPVKKIMDFGAFVELTPGTDGLVHISQMGTGRVENVTDVMQEGDVVTVKVIGFDKRGKLKLSLLEPGATA